VAEGIRRRTTVSVGLGSAACARRRLDVNKISTTLSKRRAAGSGSVVIHVVSAVIRDMAKVLGTLGDSNQRSKDAH
jgi:hypothetical protein